MLNVIALVCALSLPASDCSRDNALDVMPLRRQVAVPTECMVSGQQQIAETGIVVAGETYLKIVCERPRRAGPAQEKAVEAAHR